MFIHEICVSLHQRWWQTLAWQWTVSLPWDGHYTVHTIRSWYFTKIKHWSNEIYWPIWATSNYTEGDCQRDCWCTVCDLPTILWGRNWLAARISAIYKKGDKGKPSNYRPVSLTCITCNIMDHIVCSQISRHPDDNNIPTWLPKGFILQDSNCWYHTRTSLFNLSKNPNRCHLSGFQ